MRPLSADTRDRIARLDHAASPAQLVAELELIGASGEPMAIPQIIAFTLDERAVVAQAAGRAVAALRTRVRLRDLGDFDRAFRQIRDYTSAWGALRPRDLPTIASLTAGAALVQLAMCHANGYVREASVRACAVRSDGTEVPYLMLRANDWVHEVRTAAHAALRLRLTAASVTDVVAALPMLELMRGWTRHGRLTIVGEIDALLASPAAGPALIAATASPDRFLRRSAFRRLLGDTRAAPASLYEAALRDEDPALRLLAARALVTASPELFLAFAGRLLRDRAGTIRFATVQRLVERSEPWPWRSHLLDRHAGVRALAQQASLDADVDPASVYRAESFVAGSVHVATALLGLGETADRGEAELVYPHLASTRAGVRCAALLALAAFDVDDLVARCFDALADPSHAVTSIARGLLVERASMLRAEDLLSRFQKLTTPWGRRAALAVLATVDFWTSLLHLLRAHAFGDAVDRKQVAHHLRRRLEGQARVFTRPSRALTVALRDEVARSALDDTLRVPLAGWLADLPEAR